MIKAHTTSVLNILNEFEKQCDVSVLWFRVVDINFPSLAVSFRTSTGEELHISYNLKEGDTLCLRGREYLPIPEGYKLKTILTNMIGFPITGISFRERGILTLYYKAPESTLEGKIKALTGMEGKIDGVSTSDGFYDVVGQSKNEIRMRDENGDETITTFEELYETYGDNVTFFHLEKIKL